MPETPSTSFRSTVLLQGKTATGIVVPEEAVAALGTSKKPAVTVTIGSYSYRSTVASRGDLYLIPVSAERRAAAGVAAGDSVEVTLTLDTAPREVELPPELAELFASEPETRAAFAALSFSRQRAIVDPIDAARTPETRVRRIEKAIDELRP